MQTLLNDIELDIQELKCLMQAISTDTNPVLADSGQAKYPSDAGEVGSFG